MGSTLQSSSFNASHFATPDKGSQLIMGPLEAEIEVNATTGGESADNLLNESTQESTRVFMWYGWGILSAICFVCILAVFAELISSLCHQYRKCSHCETSNRRKSPFNLYLVFLMIPDLVLSGFCAISCIANAISGSYVSQGMCYFQSWYVVFGFTGSSWMNALIAAQVYKMLHFPMAMSTAQSRATSACYQPPTLSKIARDSLIVLLFAAFVSSWGLWNVSWLPLRTAMVNPSGISCFPSTKASEQQVGQIWAYLFFYGCFLWVLLGIPLLYVSALCYRIVHYDLLPPQGRQRVLALFFFRLGFIFLVMWLPSLIMVFMFGPVANPWVEWSGGLWGHLQGLVSAVFIFINMESSCIRRRLQRWLVCCSLRKGEAGTTSSRSEVSGSPDKKPSDPEAAVRDIQRGSTGRASPPFLEEGDCANDEHYSHGDDPDAIGSIQTGSSWSQPEFWIQRISQWVSELGSSYPCSVNSDSGWSEQTGCDAAARGDQPPTLPIGLHRVVEAAHNHSSKDPPSMPDRWLSEVESNDDCRHSLKSNAVQKGPPSILRFSDHSSRKSPNKPIRCVSEVETDVLRFSDHTSRKSPNKPVRCASQVETDVEAGLRGAEPTSNTRPPQIPQRYISEVEPTDDMESPWMPERHTSNKIEQNDIPRIPNRYTSEVECTEELGPGEDTETETQPPWPESQVAQPRQSQTTSPQGPPNKPLRYESEVEMDGSCNEVGEVYNLNDSKLFSSLSAIAECYTSSTPSA